MRRTITVLVAACMLAVAVHGAAASTFTIMEPPFRATWRALSFQAAEARVTCAVTLEGSFASQTIPKTAGGRVGSIRSATVSGCTGGTVTVLNETLPWSIEYSSFGGTLPAITSVTTRLTGMALFVHPTGQPECLVRTETRNPLPMIAERNGIGSITSVRPDETASIPLTGGFLCSFVTGTASGRGSISPWGTTADLEIDLGDVGEALTQREAAEGEQITIPLDEVDIASPGIEGTKGIQNRLTEREATVWGVDVVNENVEKYELDPSVTSACRRADGTTVTLIRRRTNTCNIKIRLKAGQPRGFRTKVNIVYYASWWVFWREFFHQEFYVRALS